MTPAYQHENMLLKYQTEKLERQRDFLVYAVAALICLLTAACCYGVWSIDSERQECHEKLKVIQEAQRILK